MDRMASNFTAPLMASDAVDREINSIENEYNMCYADDNVRLLQCLQEQCHHKNHIFNRFSFGNK